MEKEALPGTFTKPVGQALVAEQFAVVPPFDQAQVHVQELEAETADAVPAVQRFAAGAETAEVPFADQQAPLTAPPPEELEEEDPPEE